MMLIFSAKRCLMIMFLGLSVSHCHDRDQDILPFSQREADRDSPLVDAEATPETRRLFQRLQAAMTGKPLLGQENALHEGAFLLKGLKADGFHSDMRELCGKGPSIVGFDVASIVGDWWADLPQKIEGMKTFQTEYEDHMKKLHNRGGVIELAWHQTFPGSGEDSWSGPHELWRLMPPEDCLELSEQGFGRPDCGANHEAYQGKLDVLADFLHRLKDDKGAPIPIIFRPFHENSGGWFWWGAYGLDPVLYQKVFRSVWAYTVQHFQTRGIHQVIWAISPAGAGLSRDEYLSYLPGLDLVDLLGYDFYGSDQTPAVQDMRMIVELALEKNKIAALTEGGPNHSGERSLWRENEWSAYQLGPFLSDDIAKKIAYYMLWYNRPGSNQYWAPHDGHPSAADFQTLCNSFTFDVDFSMTR